VDEKIKINYLPVLTGINYRLDELKKNISKLNKAIKCSNIIMIILTAAMICLTIILVLQGLK